MADELVLYEVEGEIAFLTMNHPEKRNALSTAMLQSLEKAFKRAEKDGSIGVVVLRARGTAFSAGHDLRELASATEEESRRLFSLCTTVMETIRLLSKPVIAEVQGIATAAGCQLAATCDLVVASETATFATPGVKIGLFCSTPAVALVRAVPTKVAMEMLLTGKALDAQEAKRSGLVNHVASIMELSTTTRSLAHDILKASQYALGIGKRTFYQQLPLDSAAAYQVAEEAMIENSLHPDSREGIAAFLEKRPARWSSFAGSSTPTNG